MKGWPQVRRALRILADAHVDVRVEIEDPQRTGMALGLVCRIGQVKNGRVQLLGAGDEFQDLPWRSIYKVELCNESFQRIAEQA